MSSASPPPPSNSVLHDKIGITKPENSRTKTLSYLRIYRFNRPKKDTGIVRNKINETCVLFISQFSQQVAALRLRQPKPNLVILISIPRNTPLQHVEFSLVKCIAF